MERTIGIDTDYIETNDFNLDQGDKDFLIEVRQHVITLTQVLYLDVNTCFLINLRAPVQLLTSHIWCYLVRQASNKSISSRILQREEIEPSSNTKPNGPRTCQSKRSRSNTSLHQRRKAAKPFYCIRHFHIIQQTSSSLRTIFARKIEIPDHSPPSLQFCGIGRVWE